MGELLIDPDEVKRIFMFCLYRENELEKIKGIPEGAVMVEGIKDELAFHPGRLEENRKKVKKWLEKLHHSFQKKQGGTGWSFLHANEQANGDIWTSSTQRMDQLFCLGMGLSMVKCLAPRDMWEKLPEGKPYYLIDSD